ncbi:MAG: bifunctional UDP-N-acetylglucosamine diphosphorylase/glucosamine-1-phosphate N-acetyltransferase GlmU [Thermomicrobiales bacterium]
MTPTALIVLAAGAGQRMKSALPKPLHRVAGISMLEHVLAAGGAVGPAVTVLVVSPQTLHAAESIGRPDIRVVLQDPPLGTGDAVRVGLGACPECDRAVMLYADHPLLTGDIVKELHAALDDSAIKVAVLTTVVAEARGYGRIERVDGNPVAIVEKKSDDPLKRIGSIEINSGMMAFNAKWALAALKALEPNPESGEYYLTDLVEKAVVSHDSGAVWPVVTVNGDAESLLGVNDRVELGEAEAILLDRIRRSHQVNGVTIRLPQTTTIEIGVEIGRDSVIEPGSIIRNGSRIGEGCVIGPNSVIDRATIGNDVQVISSTLESCEVGDGTDIGPYSHLRAGAKIGRGVHIGNYVEIKSTSVEDGVKVGHVSYLGDAEIGTGTNIGAGTITVNFDGVHKNKTIIGANVFIGSDTMLVAPIEIGDGAKTGAGSVVTRDVEPGMLVVGVPAKPRLPGDAGNTSSGERNG